jgi:DNA-binding transcriptional regulator YiaG
MNDNDFENLLSSVRDMGKHMRGETVEGITITEFTEPNVKAIREQTGLSQTSFAHLTPNATKLGIAAGSSERNGASIIENR